MPNYRPLAYTLHARQLDWNMSNWCPVRNIVSPSGSDSSSGSADDSENEVQVQRQYESTELRLLCTERLSVQRVEAVDRTRDTDRRIVRQLINVEKHYKISSDPYSVPHSDIDLETRYTLARWIFEVNRRFR